MNLGRRASFLLPLSLMGCQKTRGPESVSDAFIDRYYIEKNPAEALKISTGTAAVRVAEEKRLVDAAGAAANAGPLPRVFYNRTQVSEGSPGLTDLTYVLTIQTAGVSFKKEVRLTAERQSEGFRVTAFSERDLSE